MKMQPRGFTLIELVLVIMIIGLLSTFVSKFISSALNSFIAAQNVTDSTWQLRVAFTRMQRDIRQIRSPSDVTVITGSELAFTDMTGATFDYVYTGTQLTLNGQVLADGISGGFSYFTNLVGAAGSIPAVTFITFSLVDTQKNANISLTGTAELRNFAL